MAPSPAPRAQAALAFIFVTVFIDVVGIGLLIPITPRLIAEFVHGDMAAAAPHYGALVSLFTLMQFLCCPLLGALADRFGRRPVLFLSLAVTALSYVGVALAPSLAWVFVARGTCGVASASLTVATTYIADVSTPETRARNFGLFGATFGLGFIIGPALGGVLADIGLRVPFYAAAAAAVVNLAYGAFVLPESLARDNRRAITWERANPISWITLLRRWPLVLGLAGAMFFAALGQQCLQTGWVPYMMYRFNWSTRWVGVSLAAFGVFAVITQAGLMPRILRRMGERRVALWALAVTAVTTVLLGLTTRTWMVFAVMPIASLGGMANPTLMALVSRQVGPDQQGSVQGAFASLNSLAGIVAPYAGNELFSIFASPGAPVSVPGVAFLLGGVLAVISLAVTTRVFARFAPEVAVARRDPGHPVPAG